MFGCVTKNVFHNAKSTPETSKTVVLLVWDHQKLF